MVQFVAICLPRNERQEWKQVYKQYLRLKVRFGSVKNVLEILISTAHYAQEWAGPCWRVWSIIPITTGAN